MLTKREEDTSNAGFKDWTFNTVHFWGTDPNGEFILLIDHNVRILRKYLSLRNTSRHHPCITYAHFQVAFSDPPPSDYVIYGWFPRPLQTIHISILFYQDWLHGKTFQNDTTAKLKNVHMTLYGTSEMPQLQKLSWSTEKSLQMENFEDFLADENERPSRTSSAMDEIWNSIFG